MHTVYSLYIPNTCSLHVVKDGFLISFNIYTLPVRLCPSHVTQLLVSSCLLKGGLYFLLRQPIQTDCLESNRLSLYHISNMASSAGGSDLFANYEQDFSTVSEGLRNKIDQQIPSQTGGNVFSFFCQDLALRLLCRATQGHHSSSRARSRRNR